MSVSEIQIKTTKNPIAIAKNWERTTIDSAEFIEKKIVTADHITREKNKIEDLLKIYLFKELLFK